MKEPLIFFKCGWMTHYKGVTKNDPIQGGEKYIQKNGDGGEAFNFSPIGNECYAYVNVHKIDLDRIGAKQSDLTIKGTVVFVAKNPFTKRLYVVGWYKNATIFREGQIIQDSSRRDEQYYLAVAHKNDCRLLTPFERTINIPSTGMGKFGQNPVWYCDSPEYKHGKRKEVLNLVNKGIFPKNDLKRKWPKIDPLKRKEVEVAAVTEVTAYFEGLGYNTRSVEKENLGWDLEAENGYNYYLIEVKGLSGREVNVMLSSNEYRELNRRKEKGYIIGVVTSALKKPKLFLFTYNLATKKWTSENGEILEIKPDVSGIGRIV